MRGEALRWGRRWAAGVAVMGVLAAGVLALGGCTADADAEPGPSVSTSGSPTVSASPSQSPIVAPVRPAEMERSDEVGALAAAEYFMELFSYVFRSGDLAEWNAVSAQDCSFCANVLADVEATYLPGGSYRGGAFARERAELVAHDPSIGVYTASVAFSIGEFEVVDRAGAYVRTIDAEAGTALLDVIHAADGWTLLGGMPRPADQP